MTKQKQNDRLLTKSERRDLFDNFLQIVRIKIESAIEDSEDLLAESREGIAWDVIEPRLAAFVLEAVLRGPGYYLNDRDDDRDDTGPDQVTRICNSLERKIVASSLKARRSTEASRKSNRKSKPKS